MVASRYFIATPGLTQIFHPSLVGVNVLNVKREGTGYDETAGAPGNRQFWYVAGRIVFQNAFTGSPADDVREIVFVLYET